MPSDGKAAAGAPAFKTQVGKGDSRGRVLYIANPPLLESSTKPHSVVACAHSSSLPTAVLGNVVSLLKLGALLLTESQNFANTQGGENGH